MTYHVTCPYSGEVYSYEKLVAIRRFVYAMMVKKDCQRRIRIRDGRQMVGTMWKVGRTVYYRTKHVRTARIVNQDGTTRRI